ncbi:polyprenyl synthetase family protein, partial [Rhodopirellula bahusiensis]
MEASGDRREQTSDTSESLTDYLNAHRPAVDAALESACQDRPGVPERLAAAIRYAVLAPGKRLRPILTIMAAEACGGDAESAMPSAVAVEMIHAYSLIHDDLPAMDDDDLRRGRPTTHVKFDEATAILAGDALQSMAFAHLH